MTDAEKELKISYLWFSGKDGWQVTSFKPEDDGEATGYLKRRDISNEFVDRVSYERAQEKIKQLEARVDKLREALEFYGDREETRESFDQLDWDLVNNNAALQDRGKRARAALKEDEESK